MGAFKTGIERVEVLSTPVVEERSAGVKVSGKMFNLLTRIYSRPLEAGVREIINNAIDANIEAGRPDAPVIVKIPRVWDTMFSVRDHGLGMTHDFMMNRYMRLGDSTKEMDAAQTGFWGIGSKSPLAITDQYWVTCYQGGEQRVYSITRKTFDEDNGSYDTIPVIGLVSTSETTEPDGVEVSWAIDTTNQYKSLEQAVRLVIAGTRDRANLVIERDGAMVDDYYFTETALFEGENWAIYDKAYNNEYYKQFGRNGAMIRVGRILYNLNISAVLSNKTGDQVEAIRNLFSENSIIEVPISSVQVSPSREDLEYTPATCKVVYEAALKVVEEINAEVQQEIDDSSSVYEATGALMRWYRNGRIRSFIGKRLWKGVTLNPNGIEIPSSLIYQRLTGTAVGNLRSSFRPVSWYRRNNFVSESRLSPGSFKVRVYMSLWNDARCRSQVTRVYEHLKSLNVALDTTEVLWVRCNDQVDLDRSLTILKGLGLPDGCITNIWDLPKIQKVSTPTPRAKKPKIAGTNIGRVFRLIGNKLVSEYLDFNSTDGHYVLVGDKTNLAGVDRNINLLPGQPVSSLVPRYFQDELIKAKATYTMVVYVRESEFNKVVKNGMTTSWAPVFDLLEEALNKIKFTEEEWTMYLNYNAINHSKLLFMLQRHLGMIGSLDPILGKIQHEMLKNTKSLDSTRSFTFERLNQYLGGKYIQDDFKGLVAPLADLEVHLLTKYPDLDAYAQVYNDTYSATTQQTIMRLAAQYMRLMK